MIIPSLSSTLLLTLVCLALIAFAGYLGGYAIYYFFRYYSRHNKLWWRREGRYLILTAIFTLIGYTVIIVNASQVIDPAILAYGVAYFFLLFLPFVIFAALTAWWRLTSRRLHLEKQRVAWRGFCQLHPKAHSNTSTRSRN